MSANVSPSPTLSDFLSRGAEPETFVALADARVVVADYEQIARDFPHLRSSVGGPCAPADIDQWLVENMAVVSRPQAGQNVVNSPIPVTAGRVRPGARPPRYGRAAVVAVDSGGRHVVDVKGVGVREGVQPEAARQRNGLIPLYCALYEFIMHRLVDAVFRDAGAPHRTLPTYAVIDAGFDELELGSARPRPAGLLVRRAHHRHLDSDLPREGSSLQNAIANAEFVLRHYGITSNVTTPWLRLARMLGSEVRVRQAGFEAPHSSHPDLRRLLDLAPTGDFDGINVQCTNRFDHVTGGIELVDLHYMVRERFELPLVSTVCDHPHGLGGVLAPTDAEFVQPMAEITPVLQDWRRRLPTEQERARLQLEADAAVDGGILACMEAVRGWRATGAEGLRPAIGALERARSGLEQAPREQG